MPKLCLQCDDGTELVFESRDLPFDYKGRRIVVPAVEGWHCPVCSECEFSGDEGARYAHAIEAHMRAVDAQESAELARIRKKLRITQKEAARITGGGPNAFSRYEHGKAKPMPAVINLFRLLDRHPELLDELRAA